MSGSGGGYSSWSRPASVAKEVSDAEKSANDKANQTEIANLLLGFLSDFNNRDTALVHSRLEDILSSLGDLVDGNFDQVFGGSVAKHTYVDGLSDIDCLLKINDTELADGSPEQALKAIEGNLRDQLGDSAEVTSGDLAITIKYPDNMELQLLPALKSGDQYKIASSRDQSKWSEVDPSKFTSSLTKYNQQCDQKLVPTIKLAKAIISDLPDARQLSGYHVESLAIDAFKRYDGPKTMASMLPHFFEHAKTRVLAPMTDKTGQSVNVDAYMGGTGSQERNAASHLLARIHKRIQNANSSGSLKQWASLFGDNE